MATRLDGRQLAAQIEERLQAVVADRLQGSGRPPGLAVLRVGDDPASGVYVANKEKIYVEDNFKGSENRQPSLGQNSRNRSISPV